MFYSYWGLMKHAVGCIDYIGFWWVVCWTLFTDGYCFAVYFICVFLLCAFVVLETLLFVVAFIFMGAGYTCLLFNVIDCLRCLTMVFLLWWIALLCFKIDAYLCICVCCLYFVETLTLIFGFGFNGNLGWFGV